MKIYIANDGWTIGDPYIPDVAYAVSGNPKTKNNTVNGKYYEGDMIAGVKLFRKLYQNKLIEEYPMSASWDQYLKDLATEKSGMGLMATWMPPQLPQYGANLDDIGMFPITDAKILVMNTNHLFGISKQTKYP